MNLPVIVLLGPTATGKTALGVDLALAWAERGQAAEVVNADSMLVYRGLDIGTAKPSLTERRGIAHHLIDILDLSQPASVALFQTLARRTIADCLERGAVPILVGGSALYLHAIIDQVDFPPTDPALRARLSDEMDRLGPAAMHQRLAALDPQAARAIDPGNTRRVVRALEAVALQGGFTAKLPAWSYALPGVRQFGIDIARDELDARIARRVDAMWQAGFVDEVRRLEAAGLRQAPTASRAIGYRQILDYLDGGADEAAARQSTVVKTRQFSRKQLSWWKRDPRIEWLPLGVTADQLLARLDDPATRPAVPEPDSAAQHPDNPA